MLENLRFYIKHSLNDLRVNRQRTLFALLCIAAGVAAIVSLQTLAVMIGDTLTGNLQESNRGDMRINVTAFGGGGGQQEGVPNLDAAQQLQERGIEEGVLEQSGIALFAGLSDVYIGQNGLDTLQAWFDENYPGQAELTYRQLISNTIGIFTGSGAGTVVSALDSGFQGTSVTPISINPQRYPLYGRITANGGQTLSELMTSPTDVVLSDNLAALIEVEPGDLVRLNGASTDFTVRGIAPAEAEGGFENILGGLFGFYYIGHDAMQYFDRMEVRAEQVYVRLADPARVIEINAAFLNRFPYLNTTNTEQLLEQNQTTADLLNRLVTVMGLISLLLGGIGIINTMQVIVRRRTLEVAVLKTIGMEGTQVTILFLVEAFLMGVLGSLIGIVLGWGMTFLIRGVAETFLAQALPFRITPGPAINGLVVGTLVTTIFGFLPTLAAGQVRPGLVLRPNDDVIPRTGCLASLGALLVVIVAISLVAQSIVGSLTTALAVIFGAFIAAGFLYVLLLFFIWLLGRFLPSFGLVDLKISLRTMFASRRRGATTLLALAVGVFSLSLITLLADAANRQIESFLVSGAGGNVLLQSFGLRGDDSADIERVLTSAEGINSYALNFSYNAELVSLEEGDTGAVVEVDALKARLEAAGEDGNTLDFQFSSLGAREVDSNLPTLTFSEGRQLTPEDAGQPVMIVPADEDVALAGINVGDKLTFELQSGERVTFTVVGVAEQSVVQTGGAANLYAPIDAFPAEVPPDQVSAVVDVDEDAIPELRRALGEVPGVLVLETKVLNRLLTGLLGQLTSFPILVAALGLVVGGVVIANSVALSTLERRREIAVMKSIGLQRERVLGMLLIENGILGLIGGLVGVGLGLLMLVVLFAGLGAAGGGGSAAALAAIPYGSALTLMGLCVVVALVAALTTAWGASGEKPLNVLRYE